MHLTMTQKKIAQAQNPKKGPKTRSKSKVRIEGYIENGCFSPLRIDPKIDFEPYCNPKNSPSGPEKAKTTQKLSQD